MKTTQSLSKTVSEYNKPIQQRRGERGQSLVELAMSLTVIMLLLAGAVDFSIAYFSFAALQDAAQEGAMYGSINPGDDAGIKSRVRGASTNPVDLSDDSSVIIDVTVSGDGCEGGEVTVNVSYDYPISMPFIGAIIGTQKIKLNASVTDTILQSEDISLCSGS
ncbi:MAG: TadE/TadG family type IV pilus assembly protein [Anaerolineales bacterium]|jgi:Flp pilus assembly protein TadG